MKKIKLSLVLLLIISLFTIALTSCFGYGDVYKTKSSGYFRYQVDKETNEAMLVGLTEEGEQQETIIIPSVIDGYKLTTIGYPVTVPPGKTIQYEIDMKSDKLKELYIPSSMDNSHVYDSDVYNPLSNINTVYCGGKEKSIFIHHTKRTKNFKVYVSYNHMSEYGDYYNSFASNSDVDYSHVTIANVVYYLNDDTEDSYFVDDCDNEKIVNIPTDPIRDGYKFMGWYKEKECINKWDFENDIVSKKQYDENNEYIFIETSLYAKWKSK